MCWAAGPLPASPPFNPERRSRSQRLRSQRDGWPRRTVRTSATRAPRYSRAVASDGHAVTAIAIRTQTLASRPSEVHWVAGAVGFPNAVHGRPQYAIHRRYQQFRPESVQVLRRSGRAGGWSFGGRLTTPSIIRSLCKSPGVTCGHARPGGRVAVALSEPRFYRQRHPQHVGAGEDDFLRWPACSS